MSKSVLDPQKVSLLGLFHPILDWEQPENLPRGYLFCPLLCQLWNLSIRDQHWNPYILRNSGRTLYDLVCSFYYLQKEIASAGGGEGKIRVHVRWDQNRQAKICSLHICLLHASTHACSHLASDAGTRAINSDLLVPADLHVELHLLDICLGKYRRNLEQAWALQWGRTYDPALYHVFLLERNPARYPFCMGCRNKHDWCVERHVPHQL